MIIDFFYNIARENMRIRSFTYGKAFRKGAGTDRYPMMWLDDPLTGGTATDRLNVLAWTCNLDILGIPNDDDGIAAVQAECFLIGIGIAEHAKRIYRNTGVTISGFRFTSLSHYYDDGAAGYRFTYTVSQANPVDRCANDYDPGKVLVKPSVLPSFITDNPEGCAVFSDSVGLPNFSVK